MLQDGTKPLGYRRVSDLLVEVANSGLAQSQTISSGRRGYGTQYRLMIPPEMVGNAVSKEWWAAIEKSKAIHDASEQLSKDLGSMSRSAFGRSLGRQRKNQWDSYIGL